MGRNAWGPPSDIKTPPKETWGFCNSDTGGTLAYCLLEKTPIMPPSFKARDFKG